MKLAIEKARDTGIGAITMSNGRHAGMIAYHAMMALPHDMIGYAITAGGQPMPPTFGAEPRLAPNPHAWAVPTDKEPPFVLDISSSSLAMNKLTLLRRMNALAIPGVMAESDGTPIMDEREVPDDAFVLPNGGTRELGSHKGYSLSAVAQIFAGILSDGAFGPYEGGKCLTSSRRTPSRRSPIFIDSRVRWMTSCSTSLTLHRLRATTASTTPG
jgi:LDH2 family malate/lactate/ureidoglycolate dehydrogenase